MVHSPLIHEDESKLPSISLFVFDKMSRSSFLCRLVFFLMYRNEMKSTISFIQELKEAGYDIFEFPESNLMMIIK